MKILVLSSLFATLGILPVYAYQTYVQPQLDSMKVMYGSMDQLSSDVANGKDVTQTDTYRSAKSLAGGTDSGR